MSYHSGVWDDHSPFDSSSHAGAIQWEEVDHAVLLVGEGTFGLLVVGVTVAGRIRAATHQPQSGSTHHQPTTTTDHQHSHPRRTSCIHHHHHESLPGYGTEGSTKYWTLKNSWGANWGEQGYFRVKRGQDTAGIESLATASTPIIG